MTTLLMERQRLVRFISRFIFFGFKIIFLVLSNRDSFAPTWNVYTPIYATKNDSSKLKSSITKWCTDAFERIEEFDIDEAEHILKASLDLSDPSREHAKFIGKVFIRNSTVKSVNAKRLKGKTVSFTNETASRFNSLNNRLSQLATAVNHVTNKIRFTKATRRSKRQAPVLVENLTINGPIKIKSINGRPVTDLVYTTNSRNTQLRDVIANEVVVTKELSVNGKVDGVEVREDNVLLKQPQQILRPMTVNNLSVKTLSEVVEINGLPFDEIMKLLHGKVDPKIPNMINELTVDTMTIERFLNDRNFTAMSVNSMKTSGDQVVTGAKTIGHLKANNVFFRKALRDQRISGTPLAMLVNVNDTRQKIEIKQDIRFTDELNVNRLFVTERINNVNVKDGFIQVMRKRGPTSQTVTGEKFFDTVHLLSPIVLQGKIESKTLAKMNPIVTIDENLVLQGDYKISGPVTIRRYINATEDIVTLNSLSLKNLADKGLNLFTTKTTDSNLVFENVVEVRRNLEAKSLNQKAVGNFVKANFPDMQTVRGLITFNRGLKVHSGTVQADIINDVDLKQLNNTILKRVSSSTQFIDGNAEFVNLKVGQLVAPKVLVGSKNINKVLDVHTKQDLSSLELNNLRVKTLNVTNMVQAEGGKIFNHDINFLIDDIVVEDTSDTSVLAKKIFSDLIVDHLEFQEGNEWKAIIANFEDSIAQDLNVVDNLVFKNEMKISNLVVSGTINGVSYDDMIKNWMQVEGDQVFTASQTITSIGVEEDLVLSRGTINDIKIASMINESIWIDEPMYVENVVIEGDMIVRGKVMTPTVNGMNLQEKLILNNTNEPQNIPKLVVDGNADVSYIKFDHINDIDIALFDAGLGGSDGTADLIVNGNVKFNYEPKVNFVNDQNIQELHDSIWMADNDVELSGDDIQFLAETESKGTINSDVSHELNFKLRKYYFLLLSRASTEKIFNSILIITSV